MIQPGISLEEQVPFGAGRWVDINLSWFWQQIRSDTPTEMSQDLVIKALRRVLKWLQQEYESNRHCRETNKPQQIFYGCSSDEQDETFSKRR